VQKLQFPWHFWLCELKKSGDSSACFFLYLCLVLFMAEARILMDGAYSHSAV